MVNPELFSRASKNPSESQTSFQNPSASFKEELMRRDADDIFARVPGNEYDLRQIEAVHIVRHAKGSEVHPFFFLFKTHLLAHNHRLVAEGECFESPCGGRLRSAGS